jgi:subtilisin family serine protease
MITVARAVLVLLWVTIAASGCTPVRPEFLEHATAAGPAGDPAMQILVTLTDDHAVPFVSAGATPKSYRDLPIYGPSAAARSVAAGLARDYGLREVAGWPIEVLGVHCIVYEVARAGVRSAVLKRLAADPRVALAQPMQVFATRSAEYDDPYVALQHGFAQMNVGAVQRLSTGQGVRVAIIDSGVDIRHPDLRQRAIERADFVPPDHHARADGDHGAAEMHGLAVAGIIGATANNGVGIVGIAPGARLIVLRACWQQPGQRSAAAACNSFTLALALAKAIEARADVINLSLTGPRDPLLEQLLDRAAREGSIVVGAVPPDRPASEAFPTANAAVIAVRAAELPDSTLSGAVPAPGIDVLTLRPGAGYDFESGSSMAAAHVTGLIALLLARRADLTPGVIRRILEHSITPVAQVGRGAAATIDACRALASLDSEPVCGPQHETVPVVTARARASEETM